ncbi:phosphatase PAP2 family protein [Kribbella qitaiheensis]|uniref:phosphatase PAP2 family protein n=1 Tax=Kribbella qitaiheensis TaxID=1544730 RepID=UPI00360601E5
MAIAVAGTIGTAMLADSATEKDGWAGYDLGLTKHLVGMRTFELTDLARALTFLGDVPVVCLLTVFTASLLWRVTKHLRPSVLLLTAIAGSGALTYAMKLLVARQRPGPSYVLGSIDTSYSFPSGHTLDSTAFLLTLAGLLWMSGARLMLRIGGGLIAVLLSVGIGLSRLYLGYHWATDVLAGWLLAITWLSVLATCAHLTRGLRLWPSRTLDHA